MTICSAFTDSTCGTCFGMVFETKYFMKMIKTGILGLSLVVLLMSCDTQEKARLTMKVDSLSTELRASQETASQMEEVDVLIDSIDISRHVLRANVVEGTSYDNYATRLKSINQYIKDTQVKIAALEQKSKNAKGMSSTIKRLKADLELRSNDVAALQLEVSRLRSENKDMAKAISQKDSVLIAKEGVIKIRESDIASLETMMRSDNDKSRIATANLYFDQAAIWEKVADRTNFAPRKKKQARREALELYKVSLLLGKAEAQEKIDNLEKELS